MTRWLFAAMTAILAIAPLSGQMNTAAITGSVKDQLGGAITGASITAELADTGQKFNAVTNEAGEYLLPRLPVGAYSLHVNAVNFKQSVISRVEAHVGEVLRRDFMLQIGDASEVVLVEAADSPLQSEQIGDVVQNRQVMALPLKGRQFLDLAMLSEGVVRPPGGTRGDALQQAGNLVNVLGQRSGHNLYLIDGVSVTDEHFNNMVVAPSVDSIEEFNIQKTSYLPEFGSKSGAMINVVTKSGTNAFHGSLFEFLRNSVFDAKNFFDSGTAPIPPFRQNQFGGSFGGPIVKNRTFFFLSYEGQLVRKSLTQTFSVPTAAMRRGDFNGLATIYDPSTTSSSGQRQPFAGNQLTSIDPAAAAMLAEIPLPNLSGVGQNLRATEGQRINENQYSARLDHQLTDKDNLFARASLFDAREFDPFGSSVLQETLLPGFGRNLSTHSINGVGGWTHVFGPNILNEARFGALTVVGGQGSPNQGTNFAAQNGIQGVNPNPLDTGYSQFAFGGLFTTMGDPNLFTYRNNRDFEFYDNVTLHRGTHTIKAGVYATTYNLQAVNPSNARGVFTYSPRFTSSAAGLADGNAFADFLLGDPTTAQVGIGRGAIDGNTTWWQFFAQDSWQVTPRFKLDYGLRYEYNSNMTDSANNISAIDPSVAGGRVVIASNGAGTVSPAASALLPLLPIPYVTSAAAGWNNSLLTTAPVRLAPRFGFAWSPFDTRTVVRGSYGIYPNQAAYSIVTNLAQNLPFFVTKTVSSSATAPMPTFTTQNALVTTALGTVGGNNLNHQFRVEYNEVWNASVEREFSGGVMLSAAYIGSHTVHADSSTVLNVPMPGPGAIAARRPIPQLSQFNTIRWDGWSTYNALTIAAKRRFRNGLMFDANWTLSHSIDDASDPGATLNEANLPQNVYDTMSEKASSSFDHRQRLVLTAIYQIPTFRAGSGQFSRAMHAALSQWQVGGYFTAQSGAPFTVNISTDQANIGAGPAQRPNVTGNPNGGPQTPQQWFNTSVFSLPTLYTFGNLPRNALIGPGLQEFDVSLQKEFGLIRESMRLQFRAEAYNLFNHPNFNIPNRTAFTPNFGTISSAQDPRQMQFALKFIF